MKAILDKLSSYNIFNYLFPGFLFVIVGEKLTSIPLFYEKWFIGMFLYYFYGLVISRIGSMVVEPILKRVQFVQFADYKDYVAASKLDSKIEIFSEQNNMYRTLCSLTLVLIFLKATDKIKDVLSWGADVNSFIFLAGLLILFLFSYRKQTRYVVQRVRGAQKEKQE